MKNWLLVKEELATKTLRHKEKPLDITSRVGNIVATKIFTLSQNLSAATH